MNKEDIHKAFLNTTFRIQGTPIIDVRIDKITPELNYLNSWVFLTAWNPLPKILSEVENKRRNLELEEDIRALDLKYNKGVGISEDEKWQEDSFFIENCTEEKANELAMKYGQLAFVCGERNKPALLVYTQKSNF
ncbi:DUF3293 domain-containing protein [Flavobacterium taihuense]|uniref:DUF3293 domain-containing protein n=1 Tax=Flavobacterium taihuense TaxID=2857508 RepID=A0ABS6XSQ0_9FLAO|nr:DUF3293 domain-containing protein [Flavobacterium taihuense]MBW4359377.1 DUF3293 domain-containing protein [Flavobacterium taihuense]